ncbi:MAG TPA: leucine-rich repeat domain-containing protein [Candidatus Acidoferrum sp.]|nr:leucine-rich repeat domain-containing protein [Candidatus Acidoferrum sp.]
MKIQIQNLLPALTMLLLPALGQAQFSYTNNGDGTATITGYSGSSSVVTIPGTISGLTVADIGDSAFQYANMSSVIISDAVLSIGAQAFDNCMNLTNVAMGSGVKTIGYGAFQNSKLSTIAIPASVTNIGHGAFASYYNTSPPYSLFNGLQAISVDPANSFYSSSNGVLFDKYQTTLIEYPNGGPGIYVVPDSVSIIGDWSFFGCKNLTNITLGGNVTSLGFVAFGECENLTNLNFGTNVTSIGTNAFEDCFSLTSVTFPDSVVTIHDNAFLECLNLNRTAFGHGLTTIGQGVFSGCDKLTSVTIPSNVLTIGVNAFGGCTGLTNVAIGSGVTSLSGFYFCTNLTSIVLPDSVTNLGDYAFDDCVNLTNVTIGNHVAGISSGAFYGCDKLTRVTLPASVHTIGSQAFGYCYGLADVIIPSSVTSIGNSAFYGCVSLTNVTINAAIASVGGYAFASCSNLITAYFSGNAPFDDSTLFYNDASVTIYYSPCASGWGFSFAGRPALPITIPILSQLSYTTNNDAITINNYSGCGLKISIPGTIGGLPVTSIADYAFAFSGLTSVTLPASVTSLGEYAFYDCDSLTSVFFSGNAPAADSSAFYNDDGIWPPSDPATIYYLSGTTGWDDFSGVTGLPAVLWNPFIQTGDATFGVRTNRFGFTITGTADIPMVVQASANLAAGVWVTVQSATLTNGSLYFSDPQWTNYPARFYRISSP